jgi:hypothetical protein
MKRIRIVALAILGGALFAAPAVSFAQTDEIQVYDASIAEQGVFNLMIHDNYTPRGIKTPAFPGAIISDQSWNGTAEWAYGVRPWFEQGLYLPVYSIHTENKGATINGFKIRELFVKPHADQSKFFYGINFEFSVNADYWDRRTISQEFRGIIGWHLNPIDIIINPIMDTDWTGGFGGLEFVPAERIAYNFKQVWAVAAEEYEDDGPLRGFVALRDQYHMAWAVVDHNSKIVNVEFGVGFGLTHGTDNMTIKLMLSRDLNHPKGAADTQ